MQLDISNVLSVFQVMKSVCSKSRCKVDGMKPTMILPAAIIAKESRRLFPEKESDSNSEESDYSYDYSSEEDNAIKDDDALEDKDLEHEKKLKKTWESLSPPNKEEDLIGKWYGVIYESKRCSMQASI